MSQDPKKCPVTHLTTDAGAPVVDNQNSMTAGARGPLLAQDLWLNEKLGNFVRELANIHALKFSLRLAKKLNCLHVSQPLQANVVQQMLNAISVVLH